MVLTTLVSEFGLQKKIAAGHDAGAIGSGQALADSGFMIVAALVGGVDAAKTRADGEFGQGSGAVFLPRGAVEKIRDGKLGGHCRPLCHEETRLPQSAQKFTGRPFCRGMFCIILAHVSFVSFLLRHNRMTCYRHIRNTLRRFPVKRNLVQRNFVVAACFFVCSALAFAQAPTPAKTPAPATSAQASTAPTKDPVATSLRL